MAEFCKCGSLKVAGECTNQRCPQKDQKLFTWIIDGVQIRFKEPVTRHEAEKMAMSEVEKIKSAAKASPGGDAWAVAENRVARVEKIRRKRG